MSSPTWSSHVPVVVPALEARKPVLCEKPLGLTVRACQAMIDAAARTGTMLATAENYRRDPPNRLAKAVIDAGLLGHLHLMSQFSVGGDDRIIITPWRHMKDRGAIGMDMGVHYTDIIQYYLGEFDSVQGHGFIAEPVRRPPHRARDKALAPIRPAGGDAGDGHADGRGQRGRHVPHEIRRARAARPMCRRVRGSAGISAACTAGSARSRFRATAPAAPRCCAARMATLRGRELLRGTARISRSTR